MILETVGGREGGRERGSELKHSVMDESEEAN